MDRETFTKEFLRALEQHAPKYNSWIDLYPANPESGLLQGAVFRFKESPISVMVCPDLFYPHYTESVGIGPLVQVAMSSVARQAPIDLEAYDITKEKAADHLVASVVNYEQNKKLLRNVPHERLLDLALIAKWSYQPGHRIEVTDRILSELQMTKEEVLSVAKKNTFSKVRDLRTLEFEESCLWEPEDYAKLKKNPTKEKIYVLSTEGYQEGAALIADKKALDFVHDKLGEDFYILPVEDYRLLLIKQSDCDDVNRLMQRILEEKKVTYDWSENLSKEPYLYDGHKLRFARKLEIKIPDFLADTMKHHRSR